MKSTSSQGPRGREATARQANSALLAAAGCVLFFLSAPFSLQLGEVILGPPTTINLAAYLYMKVVLSFFVVIIAISSREIRSNLLRVNPYPFLLFILFIASALWSPDGYITIRAAMEYCTDVAFGYLLICALDRRSIAKILLHTLAFSLIASVVWVIIFPDIAIHTETNDLVQDGHGGMWRGVYLHKNLVGDIAGLSIPLLLGPGRDLIGSRFIRFFYLGVSALCLVMAASGSGLILTVFGLAFIWVFSLRLPLVRLAVAFLGLMAGLALLIAGDDLLAWGLELIGKDPTLTGRTLLWETAWELASERLWFGRGYPSTSDQYVFDAFWASNRAGNAHNAYLQILIESGVVGLTLWGAAILRPFKTLLPELMEKTPRQEVVLLGTIILVVAILGFVEVTPIDTRQSLLGCVWLISIIAQGSWVPGDRKEPQTRSISDDPRDVHAVRTTCG